MVIQNKFIYAVEAKIFTPRDEYIEMPVNFLLEQFENGLFVPEYEKSSVIPAGICNKPCSVTIISRSTKWMTVFRSYPASDT